MLGAGDASQMIQAAHTDKALLCVSKHDLLAPCRTKERRRHEELCAVLRVSYVCPFRFEDFLTASDDEETTVESITPLEVVELKPGDRLLVVTCNYQLAEKTVHKGIWTTVLPPCARWLPRHWQAHLAAKRSRPGDWSQER